MSFEGRNYHSEYEYKVKLGEKANGEIQIKEITVASNNVEQLTEIAFKLLIDTHTTGKNKGLKMVNPFIE